MNRTLIVTTALALGLLAGCGSSNDDDSKVLSLSSGSPSAGATGAVSNAEKSKQFAQCLRDNGIDVADPNPQTGQFDQSSIRGVDQAKMQKALGACRDKMPQQNSEMEKLRNPDAATKAKMVKFAQCMRDEGQDFDDPGPNGFDFSKFNRNDSGFQKAAQICQKKFPFANMGGGQ